MHHPTFRPNVEPHLKKIDWADIVIGLPTYKNPQQAASVARVMLQGARQFYPQLRVVLIQADTGADNITRLAVETQVKNYGYQDKFICGRYTNTLGRGNAIAAIMDAALTLDAKAIVILDSNCQTVTPNWLPGLAELIVNYNADLVFPRYQWLLPDSALSDLIAYPLFRSLWGYNLRHPIALEFALSPQLATQFLDTDIWDTDAATDGLPLSLATFGLFNNWQVVQTALNIKQTHTSLLFDKVCLGYHQNNNWSEKTKTILQITTQEKQLQAQINQLKPSFYTTTTMLFSLIGQHRPMWQRVNKCCSLSTLTQFSTPTPKLVIPEIDPNFLLDDLALGWIDYRTLWEAILTPNNLTQLESLAALPSDEFYFPPNLWTRIIYDFATVFNKGERDPWQIVKALFPIYQGRLAAYWQEIAGLSTVGSEGTLAAQAAEFEDMRSYLKLRWRTYTP